MRETVAARRYAKAMAETFGQKRGLDKFSEEFFSLATVFAESRELSAVMLSPVFSDEEKLAALDAILEKAEASKEISLAFTTILENGRFAIITTIAEEFEALSYEALGKIKVEVTSAAPLSKKETADLQKKLSDMTGKEAVMSVTEDAALIGGIVAKVGSRVYDGSVINQLKALKVGI